MPPARKLVPVPARVPAQILQVKELLTAMEIPMPDLLNEEPCGLEEAMAILGVGKEAIVDYAKNHGLYHDMIANKYVFYRSLIRVWRLTRQFYHDEV